MNAVEHFERFLSQVSGERLNALLHIEVDGPHPFTAALLTRHLRDLVEYEIDRRRFTTAA